VVQNLGQAVSRDLALGVLCLQLCQATCAPAPLAFARQNQLHATIGCAGGLVWSAASPRAAHEVEAATPR